MKSSQFERKQETQLEPTRNNNNFNLSNAQQSNGLDNFCSSSSARSRQQTSRTLKPNNSNNNNNDQLQVATSQVHIEILSKQNNSNSGNKKHFNDNSNTTPTTTATIYGNKIEPEKSENYHYGHSRRRLLQAPKVMPMLCSQFNSKSNNNNNNDNIKSKQKHQARDENVLRDDRDNYIRRGDFSERRQTSSGSPAIVVVSHQFSGGNNLISVPASETTTRTTTASRPVGKSSSQQVNGGGHSTTFSASSSAGPRDPLEGVQMLTRSKVCSTTTTTNTTSKSSTANISSSPSAALLLQQVNNSTHNNNNNNNHSSPKGPSSTPNNQNFLSYLSIGSTKSSSTADSSTSSSSTTSGFSSEGSSGQRLGRRHEDYLEHHLPPEMSAHPADKQQQQQQQQAKRSIRSRLIEDLDRLERIAAAVAANQSAGLSSPTIGSQTMGATVQNNPRDANQQTAPSRAHTLTRLNGGGSFSPPQPNPNGQPEFDYFTLCRDEFSSFIAAAATTTNQGQQVGPASPMFVASNNQPSSPSEAIRTSCSPKRHQRRSPTSMNCSSGPTLVGVHECSSVGSSSPRAIGLIDSQSPSSFGTPEDEEEEDDDDDDNLSEASIEQVDIRCNPVRMYQGQDDDHNYEPNDSMVHASKQQQQHCEVQVEEYFSDESQEHPEDRLSLTSGSSRSDSLKCQEIVMHQEADDWQQRILEASEQEPQSYEHQEPLVSDEMREQGRDLSRMLDVYLQRVESLLRLANGDKLVTLGEAFGGKQIQVSGEHQTPIEFSPSERLNSRRVVQEIEMIVESPTGKELIDDDDDVDSDQDKHERYLMTNIVAENFRSLLSTPQTKPKLNWLQDELQDLDDMSLLNGRSGTMKTIRDESRKLLEDSLLSKWIESNKQELYMRHIKPANLVNTIRGHMNEFVANYNAYQQELNSRLAFASDWHQNWLFAYKRPHWSSNEDNQRGDYESSSSPKQARLSDHNDERPIEELINYSTLLLSKHKTTTESRLSYLLDTAQGNNNNNNGDEIEILYEQQQSPLDELKMISIESGAQVDVCRLIINDLFADESDDWNNNNDRDKNYRRKSKRRSVEVRYESSLDRIPSGLFRLFACGHSIEFGKLREISNSNTNQHKLTQLKKLIMTKLLDLTTRNIKTLPNSIADNYKQDQVKFLVNLTNVELINQLSVIQFCAKIAGALPIKVTWFKLIEDQNNRDNNKSIELNGEKLLTTKRVIMRKNSLINDPELLAHLWPISMQANHDFEYQNDWSSWFRFKRSHDDILFEIRDADLQNDYNNIYKCVIENYCSKKECRFALSRREVRDEQEHQQKLRRSSISQKRLPNEKRRLAVKRGKPFIDEEKQDDELDQVRLRELSHETGNQEAGHALLRTWSQRTLNRPPLRSPGEMPDNETSSSSIDELKLTSANQQTVGRMSSKALDGDKFGADFPYHPENLIKRLEENKYSISLRSAAGATLKRQQNFAGKSQEKQQEIREDDCSQVIFVDDKSCRLEADYQNINSPDREQRAPVNYDSTNSTSPTTTTTTTTTNNDHHQKKPTNVKKQQNEMKFEELTSSSADLAASSSLNRLATASGEQMAAHLNESVCRQDDVSNGNQSTSDERLQETVGAARHHCRPQLGENNRQVGDTPKPRERAPRVAHETVASGQQQANCWPMPTRTSEHELIDQPNQQLATPRDQHHHHHHHHRSPADPLKVDGQPQKGGQLSAKSKKLVADDNKPSGQVEMSNTQLTRVEEPLAAAATNERDNSELQQQQVHRPNHRPQACSRQAAMDGGGHHKVTDNQTTSREGQQRPTDQQQQQEQFRPKASVKSLISRFNMA